MYTKLVHTQSEDKKIQCLVTLIQHNICMIFLKLQRALSVFHIETSVFLEFHFLRLYSFN